MIKFSIIIPFYNNKDNLGTLFETLSDYKNDSCVEIIIIDDASRAEDFNLLSTLVKSYINITLLKNTSNLGVSYTRNKGIKKSTGRYIAFLDADDGWIKDKAYQQFKVMSTNNYIFSGGSCSVINSSDFSDRRNVDSLDKIKVISPFIPLFKHCFNTPSIMIESDVIKNNLFNESMRFGEDSDCWRRIFLRHSPVLFTPSGTYSFKHLYLSKGGSLSTNTYEMSKSQLLSLTQQIQCEDITIKQQFIYSLAILFSLIKAVKRQVEYFMKDRYLRRIQKYLRR